MRPCLLFQSITLIVLTACSPSPSEPRMPEAPAPNPALGRIAFENECGSCHASRDGFDLAVFGFSDTTILRRAVAHVDTATAHDIIAYIHRIQAPRREEEMRLFQPRGTPLAGDLEFATALFGRDAWPTELTSAGLLAIDPRMVQIAARLPIWSDEASNLDWMPDSPLPAGILEYAGSAAAGAIAGYRAAPTAENLTRAVMAVRTADRAAANPGAPCLLEDSTRVNYRTCFEVGRWAGSLVAVHMMRIGMEASLGSQLHEVWWDVGNAARKSRADRGMPIANPVENWVSWMFLGWSFDPSRHASVYTGGGFRQQGLIRHATFVALRSQVARPRNSTMVYSDVVNAQRFAPLAWATAATTFGLRHLNERLTAGDRPQRPEQITEAVAAVNMAVTEATRRVPLADRAGITALGQQVLALLAQ